MDELKEITLTITGKKSFKSLAFKLIFEDNHYEYFPISLENAKKFLESSKTTIKDFENKTKIFIVNEYITLKLERTFTNIYVNGERFNQCKYLLLNIDPNKLEEYDTIKSIDEASETLDNHHEHRKEIIDPETTFQGHCSNLQVWVENNYDTRLLHRNLAFPLLKKLTEVGDPLAKEVFKEEIALRLEAGEINVFEYLVENNYLENFTVDELSIILENVKDPIARFFFQSYIGEIDDTIELQYFTNKNKYKYYIKEIHSFILEEKEILLCPYKIDEVVLKDLGKGITFPHYHPERSIYEAIEYLLVGGNKFLDFKIPSKTVQKIVYPLNYIRYAKKVLHNNPDIMIAIPKQEGSLRISSKSEQLKLYIQPKKLY